MEIPTNQSYNKECLKSGNKVIALTKIMYLKGDINYTQIHIINGQKLVTSRSLAYHIAHHLGEGFIRIHRAYCVNIAYISKIDTDFFEFVVLTNGQELAVARRRKGILKTMNFHKSD